MLQTLKDLFDTFTASAQSPSQAEREHALQLATAVLLVEAMRADPAIDAAERNTVVAALRNKFALADDELARLVELAEQTAKSAYDYHRFTSSLNEHFTQAQKIQVIENMWQVAYADAHLDAHENHLISKIAGLLYVTHGEYIAAKMRAKEAAGQA
ncbi:TerB family tellurite resistance protein [Polaromonas sp. P2-4]|nr:TerB family tellurite resistance protein [Polaromonas sp. P2-4]